MNLLWSMISENFELLVKVCRFFAAISTLAFPILYFRTAWRSTKIGRVLMVHSIAFAVFVNTAFAFRFSAPHSFVWYWATTFLYILVAVTTSAVTIEMWRINSAAKRSSVVDSEEFDV